MRLVDDAERFFRDVLELPAEGLAGTASFAVRIGASRLQFTADPDAAAQHVAFLIPVDSFAGAKAWLQDRVTLYRRDDGDDEFEGPPGWDSRSLYFPGPSGSVLEFIARRRLPHPRRAAPFGAGDILSISEIGIAVDDVRAAARAVTEVTGIGPFAAPPADVFAALGDDDGLVVLAITGRAWAPTDDRPAVPSSIVLHAGGPRAGELTLGPSRLVFAADHPG